MNTAEKRGHDKTVLELKIIKNIHLGISKYLNKRINDLTDLILKNIHENNDEGFTINFASRKEIHDFLKHIDKLHAENADK